MTRFIEDRFFRLFTHAGIAISCEKAICFSRSPCLLVGVLHDESQFLYIGAGVRRDTGLFIRGLAHACRSGLDMRGVVLRNTGGTFIRLAKTPEGARQFPSSRVGRETPSSLCDLMCVRPALLSGGFLQTCSGGGQSGDALDCVQSGSRQGIREGRRDGNRNSRLATRSLGRRNDSSYH